MRILKRDLRHGEIFLEVEDLDDLWYLSQIIDEKDIVKSLTQRKIKLSDKEGTSSSAFKKTILLSIIVEKLGFHEYADILRLSGKVSEGIEDIPSGSYHTLSIEPSSKLTIIKERWLNYQLDRLDEATKEKGSEILICAFDRDSAYFAILTRQGFKVLAELSGEVERKSEQRAATTDFYSELIGLLGEYSTRHKVKSIILASPAFWKEDLLKRIDDKSLRSKITLATCNAVGKSAITEILKRPEIKNVLKDERNARELELVERLLSEISKNSLAAYGLIEVRRSIEAGSAQNLLISTELISKKKQDSTFGQLNFLMQAAESISAAVTIVNSSNEAGKKLDGLGGIGAILRYKYNY
jgi:protein pelota